MATKIPQYIMYVLMLISIVASIMSLKGDPDILLYETYIAFVISIVLALVATVTGMISSPKGIKANLIGILVMGGLFVGCYAASSDEVLPVYGNISALTSQISGAGLYATYILSVGAVASIFFSAIYHRFQ